MNRKVGAFAWRGAVLLVSIVAIAMSGLTSAASAASGPVAGLDPTTVAFGDQVVGTVGAGRPVTLANAGDAAFDVLLVELTSPDFRLSENTCGTRLDPGRSCTMSVAFAPSAAGPRSGSLVVQDSAPGSPRSVTLTGTGTEPTPPLTLDPLEVSFGDHVVDFASPPESVLLRNTGTAELGFLVELGGAHPRDFHVRSNDCGPTLPVGASCQVALEFLPTMIGARSATLVVHDDTSDSPTPCP